MADSELSMEDAVARCRELGEPTAGDGWRRLLWRVADLLEQERAYLDRAMASVREAMASVREARAVVNDSIKDADDITEVIWAWQAAEDLRREREECTGEDD